MTTSGSKKNSEIQPKTKQAGKSKADTPQKLNLRPLPQNRPIANNNSDGITDLMGYLD
ncbi:MAG TPA: hypothetical protein V6D11_00975 [Waterburya sp.]|jgi:hypothetical protein